MSDLTDRMRTCAARIKSITDPARNDHSINDAPALLVEAADALDGLVVSLPPQGEPMAIIPPATVQSLTELIDWSIAPPVEPTPPIPPAEPSVWIAPGDPLPGLKQSGTTSPRACPRCDSRGYKRVYRISCQMMIACQVCGHSWEFGQ